MKEKNNTITVKQISDITGKGVGTIRSYKNWGLFKVRDKDGRLEYFFEDEVKNAWKMYKEYIIKSEYKNKTDKVCKDIAEILYS